MNHFGYLLESTDLGIGKQGQYSNFFIQGEEQWFVKSFISSCKSFSGLEF